MASRCRARRVKSGSCGGWGRESRRRRSRKRKGRKEKRREDGEVFLVSGTPVSPSPPPSFMDRSPDAHLPAQGLCPV